MSRQQEYQYIEQLISKAVETLLYIARVAKKPLIIPMHPPQNEFGLKSGQIMPGNTTEIRPSCDGVVLAVSCSADEAQELVDWVMDWEKRRIEKQRG